MLESMRETFIKAGLDPALVDREYGLAEAAPASNPTTPAQTPTQQPAVVAEDRSEAQIAWDQEHMLDTPRQPADYKLDLRALGLIGRPITEVTAAQEQWGTFLAGMQMDPMIGTGLVEHMSRTGRAFAGMGDAERGLWQMGQETELLRHCGSPEAVKALKQDAGLAIQWSYEHAANQGAVAEVVDAMGQSGVTKDWFVLRTLANHGANLRAWQVGRPAK
jgi:hypothetical protein